MKAEEDINSDLPIGKKRGRGRPRLLAKEKRIITSMRLHPYTYEFFRRMDNGQGQKSLGAATDQLVRDFEQLIELVPKKDKQRTRGFLKRIRTQSGTPKAVLPSA